MVVKPNAAGGSVGRARCRHRKVAQNPHSVYYYLTVQYSWFIHTPKDQEPGPTRVLGRPLGFLYGCFFFFFFFFFVFT